jgi:hypothetical protein
MSSANQVHSPVCLGSKHPYLDATLSRRQLTLQVAKGKCNQVRRHFNRGIKVMNPVFGPHLRHIAQDGLTGMLIKFNG